MAIEEGKITLGRCVDATISFLSLGDRQRRPGQEGPEPGLQTRKGPLEAGLGLAGGRGFEPRLTESESAVLPLDDPPKGDAGRVVLNLGATHLGGR